MNKTEKKSVLLVDDDQLLLDMYAAKFEEKGVEVTAFTSVDDALEYLRDGATPDAVVMDLIMPAKTGEDFVGYIRREKLAPDAALVILSNQSGDEEQTKIDALEVDGHIVKANTVPSEVLARIEGIIDEHATSLQQRAPMKTI
jgi:CheY-like chemotaxis protein